MNSTAAVPAAVVIPRISAIPPWATDSPTRAMKPWLE
jgi:hypothetical protein